ncbi:ParB/Srx family N-terminal domain-containing protein [Andreprevotia sp. IGB-42]|uniref:ParB/Srx family N-terminal domain-containing protein n=1 Tax=Andreprevotia sp. IGB-42 TaxID=2497473 RepID=UPI00135978DB|nr:ParB/Srx family N-terminal domain-containing protein [Andreprevotia sp. IGB-42]
MNPLFSSQRRNGAASLLAATLLAGALAAIATPAHAAQSACDANLPASAQAPYVCAQPGELIDVTLDALHPTQAVLGKAEIYYKLGRYRSNKDELAGSFNKRFDDWCEANGQEKTLWADTNSRLNNPASFGCTVPLGAETPATVAAMKTAVIGPGGALYLTDGHHTFTSFLETPDGGAAMHVRVRVADNLSALPLNAFWQAMQDNRRVWLRDENNQPITLAQLPDRLGLANFHDDKYRSLVYFTRDIGYNVPAQATEFLEYYWGGWLRSTGVDLNAYDLNDSATYLKLVKQASQAMAALPAGTLIDGATAADLGRIAQWNGGKKETGGEFDKLSKPFSDAKPGKLAYSLNFRADVAVTPACTTTISGVHSGAVNAGSGVLCLDRATVQGDIAVGSGASVVINGSSINGALRFSNAGSVYLCGNQINGAVAINGTSGLLQIGGNGCTVNAISGAVALNSNNGGVVLAGNTINGPVMCYANLPDPLNLGRSNQVNGPKVYQCGLM